LVCAAARSRSQLERQLSRLVHAMTTLEIADRPADEELNGPGRSGSTAQGRQRVVSVELGARDDWAMGMDPCQERAIYEDIDMISFNIHGRHWGPISVRGVSDFIPEDRACCCTMHAEGSAAPAPKSSASDPLSLLHPVVFSPMIDLYSLSTAPEKASTLG